MKQYIVLACMC
ncbi:Chemokine binding protein, partial [Monkeypox virus]